jgi:hypothetical protein
MGFRIRIAFYALLAAAVAICAGAASPAQAQVKETVLYSFSGGADRLSPYVGLIADERGAL